MALFQSFLPLRWAAYAGHTLPFECASRGRKSGQGGAPDKTLTVGLFLCPNRLLKKLRPKRWPPLTGYNYTTF